MDHEIDVSHILVRTNDFETTFDLKLKNVRIL